MTKTIFRITGQSSRIAEAIKLMFEDSEEINIEISLTNGGEVEFYKRGQKLIHNGEENNTIFNWEKRNDLGVLLNIRELQILSKLVEGYSNHEISKQLYQSQRNVEYHLTKIYKKLEVKTRVEAVIKVKKLAYN